jgi:uncharacterized membrane protein
MFIMIEKLHIRHCTMTIFSKNPTYGPTFFRHRFAINQLSLFIIVVHVFAGSFAYYCLFALVSDVLFFIYLCIVHAVEGHDDYFVQKEIEMVALGYHVRRRLL